MQTGVLSPNVLIDDTGQFKVPGCHTNPKGCVFHDDETTGLGQVNLVSALTESSDYYFYNLGYLFWSQQAKYGQTPIQNVAHDYGWTQYTDIDLPDEVQGRVDSPEVRKELHAESPTIFPTLSWYTGDNIEMAFGQGTTALTPNRPRQRLRHVRHGGKRYAPEGRSRDRQRARSDRSSLRPARVGPRESARTSARPDPARSRGRRHESLGHGVFAVQGQHHFCAHLVSDRGQDRHRE